jgi:hypothetical protein
MKEVEMKILLHVAGLVAMATSMLSAPAFAADDEAEIAKKTQNPIANLISLPLQLNYDHDIGPQQKGKTWYLKVQPVIPISLNEDWNVISRTIVPIANQMDYAPGYGDQSGVGDVTQSFFFSPKKPTDSGWIWGVGPALLIPSGNDHLSSEKWGAGPTAVFLKQEHGWTYGMLANQIWSYAGSDKHADVNATFVQPFLSYTTSHYTTFGINSESTYNRETQEWSVPLNLTVTQLLRVDKQLLTLMAGVRYWADTPDNVGPEHWGLRLQATFLFPK